MKDKNKECIWWINENQKPDKKQIDNFLKEDTDLKTYYCVFEGDYLTTQSHLIRAKNDFDLIKELVNQSEEIGVCIFFKELKK